MAMDSAQGAKKKCPLCGEMISAEAIKCRFCGEFIENVSDNQTADAVNKLTNPPYDSAKEGVLLQVRPSLAAMVNSFIIAVVLIAAAMVAGYLIGPPYGLWVGLGVPALVLIWIGIQALVLKCTSYRISQDRIEYERGVLSRCTDNLDMFRVVDVRLQCTLLDRLWGIGTVEVMSSDETHPILLLSKIRNPRNAYDVLKRASLLADQRRGVVHME